MGTNINTSVLKVANRIFASTGCDNDLEPVENNKNYLISWATQTPYGLVERIYHEYASDFEFAGREGLRDRVYSASSFAEEHAAKFEFIEACLFQIFDYKIEGAGLNSLLLACSIFKFGGE